jgi:cell division protein FtsQ
MTQTRKTTNELIMKRRRKKLIKRCIWFFIFMVSIMILLCLKLDYFNIANIEVSGNKIISTSEIIKTSGIYLGNNIFYTNISRSKKRILAQNPYIMEVHIVRRLPSSIDIEVRERKAKYYDEKRNKFLLIDENGVILQEKDSIKDMNLIKLSGIEVDKLHTGDVIQFDDKRKLQVLNIMDKITENDKNNFGIDELDLSNIVDIKAYSGNMCIKLGTSENIADKINMALNIINMNKLCGKKGYVDVSYKGNPVFYIEK